MIDLNGKTALYGIIGNPVAHSLSPLFQNYFLSQHHHNAVYLPFKVAPSALSQALHGLHATHVQGLNITVPHKESVLSLVDADSDALTIGAVNTLKYQQHSWQATNTDWQGFAAVLQGLQTDVSNTPVLLFGAGGTSRAVCHALHAQGATNIWLCNRSPDRAIALAEELNQTYPSMKIQPLPWEAAAIAKTSAHCSVIINSSSIGLDDADSFPFLFSGSGVAIDAVYKTSGQTAFTKAATAGGFSSVDGLPMLIAQGIASFSFWHQTATDFKAPDKQQSLHWVEQQLSRPCLHLPGWII